LIIDPDSKTVAEIVAAPATTGNNPDGAASPGSQSRLAALATALFVDEWLPMRRAPVGASGPP